MFVHLKDPATGAPLFVMRKKELDGGGEQMVPVLDDANKPKRIGVHVYTPGSKIYRNAKNINATANMKDGKKGLTGEKLDQQETDLLARTTFKLENMDGLVDTCTVEALRAFYDNEEFVAYREQIAEEQADLGKSSTSTAKA
jgi:hypothetical protein